MNQPKVLIVDDEEDILELLRYNFTKEGYEVVSATEGSAVLNLAKQFTPALIILDLMLPGMNGLDVCRALKADSQTKHIPIVMLTAKGEESDIVAGLELGADDYITKPFSPRILIARARSVLRRGVLGEQKQPLADEHLLTLHGISIDVRRVAVTVNQAPLELTSTEFKLLHFLVRHRGFVYTRSQIVDAVHGEDYPVTDRSVDVQVVGLRRKLGEAGEVIETVRGIGYRARE